MRTLGYYDGYLGFLCEPGSRPGAHSRVIDVGAGTAAFSEAWVAVNGAPSELALMEPSQAMLNRGAEALRARGVEPRLLPAILGEVRYTPSHEVLAAHVIEHCPDPLLALQHLFGLTRGGGRLRLVVSKPHWCNAIIWLQWRHRTFGKAEIQSLVKEAGFDIESDYAFPSGPPSRTSYGLVARRPD
ncbi:MAG: class I SAM-dependent methyltransferase [Boseongicola sp.]|nr:class I SAM-dependent methyltransferase [Boseongicola sp.]